MEDPQKFRERDARWIANNREQVRASAAAYSAKNRQAVTRRTAAWRKANPTRHAEHVKRYAQSRQHILRAKLARRRARKLRATPPWLTDEHKMLILAIYDQAVRLSTETGMAHEVDHIIPLQGDNVCGLHVPWNLRVTTMRANRAKGNRHAP
jgi:5-methylcytosine-specific restriction endonuclease McrA